jgi:cell division protease FtsH
MRGCGKYLLFFVVVVIGGTVVWNASARFQPSVHIVSFTEFMRDVDSGRVATISIDGNEVFGVNTQTGRFRTYTPRGYTAFVDWLIRRDVDVSVVPEGLWSGSSTPWALMFIVTQAGMFAVLRGYVRRAVRISSTA